MSELKPCPFCGGEARLVLSRRMVACYKCCSSTKYADSMQEAIEAWNTRAERTCHLELNSFDDCRGTQHDYLGCSKCEEFISTTDSYGPHDGPFFCSNCGCEIDHSFITYVVSGDVIWKAEDGDLGDLSHEENWRGAKVVDESYERTYDNCTNIGDIFKFYARNWPDLYETQMEWEER